MGLRVGHASMEKNFYLWVDFNERKRFLIIIHDDENDDDKITIILKMDVIIVQYRAVKKLSQN